MTKLIKYGAYLLIFLGICVHLIVGIKQPLFGDEIHSLFFANSYNYQELLTKPIEIIHPNTYYVLIKFLLQLGVGVFGLRIFQWIIFSLTLFPVYGIFRQAKLTSNQALIGLMVWTWSSYLLRYSYMIRMYGLGMLLVALSLYFALKSKFIIQLIIDILGVNLIMGYWFFIAIKYSALFIKHKKQSLIAFVLFTLLFIPTLLNAKNAQTQITSTYLYWVPIPKLTDSLPMITSLLGLTSTTYFEGYAANPTSLLSVILLLACSTVIIIMHYRKSKPEFVSYLAVSSLFTYILVFLVSCIFKVPLFHIRQLFPVAIIFTLFLAYTSLNLIHQRQLLTYMVIIPLIIFGVRKTLTYAFGPETIYPAHYQNKPSGPIYFTTADIELAYKYCGATSFADLTTLCPTYNLYLVTNTTALPGTPTLTSSALNEVNILSTSCSSYSVNFHICGTIDNKQQIK